MNPAHQVYWKELRLWLYPAGRVSRQFLLQAGPAMGVLLVLVVMIVVTGRGDLSESIFVPTLAATSGASIGMALALDAFAGERERHTLETVLTAPITPRQLLWGKMLAQITVSLVFTTIMSALALLLLVFLSADVLTTTIVIFMFPGIVIGGTLFGVFMILVANLASLRSSTVKATGPRFGLYMMLAFALTALPGILTMALVGFLFVSAGARPELVVLFVVPGLVAFVGAVGYAVYLVRSLLRETRPDAFRVDL